MSEAAAERAAVVPGGWAVGRGPLITWLVIALLAISLPFWLLTSQFAIGVAIRVLVFACLALGWNLIGGFGGQVSFGNVMFFGLGAYVPTLLFNYFDLTPWIGMLLAIGCSMVTALIVNEPASASAQLASTLGGFSLASRGGPIRAAARAGGSTAFTCKIKA